MLFWIVTKIEMNGRIFLKKYLALKWSVHNVGLISPVQHLVLMVLGRTIHVCVASLSPTVFACFGWQHHVFISENTQVIHIHQPKVGRLSPGHLGLEECESFGQIKASSTFMLKLEADLQMCSLPSHNLTIWPAGPSGGIPACRMG